MMYAAVISFLLALLVSSFHFTGHKSIRVQKKTAVQGLQSTSKPVVNVPEPESTVQGLATTASAAIALLVLRAQKKNSHKPITSLKKEDEEIDPM